MLYRLALTLLASLALALPISGFAAPSARLPTALDFSRLPALSDVSVSPDGKHIVAVTTPDGVTPYISVWRTDAPNEKPVNLASAHSTIMSVRFIKSDRLLVTTRQTLTVGTQLGHLFKLYITDLDGKNWTSALPEPNAGSEEDRFEAQLGNPELLSEMPGDPRHILVRDSGRSGDVFKVDVYNGHIDKMEHVADKFGSLQADLNGVVRAKQEVGFDGGNVYLAQWIKIPKTGAWEERFRSYAKDRAITSVVGFTTDPNIIYVAVSKGRDKAGIYEYDIAQKKILEPAFEHRMFDATSVLTARDGRTLGFTYDAETQKVYWVDDKLGAMAAAATQALGAKTTPVAWTDPGAGAKANISAEDGFNVQITSYSDDLKYVTVEKSGPNQPPEFYLLTDGTKMTLLGRSRPQIDLTTLGDTRLVEYTARDGLVIPAFLHTPPKALYGDGPYPAIVLPHGGPWARDDMEWDVSGWTKYFTSRGYVVIQPQFRGSMGWGDKLWRAGDKEWGQKMQDDNDDAAKWLIDQHLAAPNRIALFGYSYGGYAAFAAAIRPNGLYQCAISGAGVAELKDFQNDTYDDRFLREFQRPSVDGLDVLTHAKEIKIPIFIYGGDRDQTVNPNNPKRFADAAKASGQVVRYLLIGNMGHQYVTMTPEMLETQLVEIEKFLKTDCKPGGL